MSVNDPDILDTLKRHHAAMTPGPWRHGYTDGSGKATEDDGGYIIAGEPPVAVCGGGRDGWSVPVGMSLASDADGIADIRTMLPALIARIEADGAQLAAVTLERDAAREALARVEAERDEARAESELRYKLLGEANRGECTPFISGFECGVDGNWCSECCKQRARAEAAEQERDAARAAEQVQTERVAEFRRQRDEAIAERDRLRERIQALADLFGVPDGGRYLNDWKARAERIAQPTTEKSDG